MSLSNIDQEKPARDYTDRELAELAPLIVEALTLPLPVVRCAANRSKQPPERTKDHDPHHQRGSKG